MMLHTFFVGLLLGWGAAIPIGPINLEITRRNLKFGTSIGISTGLGACTADLTFLILLCSGVLVFLQYPSVLRVFGLMGSLILFWFGIVTMRQKILDYNSEINPKNSLIRNGIEGYLMTLLNPFTILFWASVSAQLSIVTANLDHAILYAGTGVIFGTVSWVFFLNFVLHHTRHRLSPKLMHRLNFCGGLILIAFAIFGLFHSFYFT